MATEMQKLIVRNIDRDSLLLAIAEREDIVEVMQMFRDSNDYAPREYLTIKEFAKYIQASEAYVRALAKYADINKIFSVTKVGREYRLDRLSYEKWVRKFAKYIQASEAYVRALAKYADINKIFSVTKVGREYRLDRLSYEKWVRNGGKF